MTLPNGQTNTHGFENVHTINSSNLYTDIRAFIRSKEIRSENTAIAYEGDIKKFFKVTRNKDLEFVTLQDVTSYRHSEVAAYQAYLSEKHSGTTVNRNMSAIKQLIEFLSRDYPEIRVQVFDTDRMHEDQKSYGIVSLDESMKMVELVKNQRKGFEKAVLMELAIRTSIRLQALLGLKWDDVTRDRNSDDIYIVSVVDKGEKRDNKPIPKELYDNIVALRGRYRNDEYIFSLDKKTCNAMIKQACEEMGIDEKRNITFHSLKKVGINWIIDSGQDILAAAEQGNHANLNTTRRYYLDKDRKNYSRMAGVNMGKEIDLSILMDMDKDELLGLIQSSSMSVKIELVRLAGK